MSGGDSHMLRMSRAGGFWFECTVLPLALSLRLGNKLKWRIGGWRMKCTSFSKPKRSFWKIRFFAAPAPPGHPLAPQSIEGMFTDVDVPSPRAFHDRALLEKSATWLLRYLTKPKPAQNAVERTLFSEHLVQFGERKHHRLVPKDARIGP